MEKGEPMRDEERYWAIQNLIQGHTDKLVLVQSWECVCTTPALPGIKASNNEYSWDTRFQCGVLVDDSLLFGQSKAAMVLKIPTLCHIRGGHHVPFETVNEDIEEGEVYWKFYPPDTDLSLSGYFPFGTGHVHPYVEARLVFVGDEKVCEWFRANSQSPEEGERILNYIKNIFGKQAIAA